MQILLLGEAPARGTTAPFSNECVSGKRFRELVGDHFNRLKCANLFTRPTSWDLERFRRQASRVVLDAEIILLAGKRLANAFGIRNVAYFEPCMLQGRIAYVIPHPSGRNRFWNNEFNRFRAERFFTALFLALDGVECPDGDLDAAEFRVLATATARRAGRVYG